MGYHLLHCQYNKLYAGTLYESRDLQVCHAHGTSWCNSTLKRKVGLLVTELKTTTFPLPVSRRPSGLGLISGPLVSEPFYSEVMFCQYIVMLSSEMELTSCEILL